MQVCCSTVVLLCGVCLVYFGHELTRVKIFWAPSFKLKDIWEESTFRSRRVKDEGFTELCICRSFFRWFWADNFAAVLMDMSVLNV